MQRVYPKLLEEELPVVVSEELRYDQMNGI